MPSTPFASIRVIVNGGAPQTGGILVDFEDEISLDAESTVGWGQPAARWEITDYPEGFATPAGWSLDGVTGAIYYLASNITGTTPPAFTLPTALSNLWGKWKFRLLVNGGGGQLTDWSTTIEIVSPAGVHDTAVAESSEFGGVRVWVGPVKENWRALSAAIEGGVGGGVSLGAGTPHTLSMAVGGAGGLATAAPFDHWHQVLVGTPSAIGEANAPGSGPQLAAKDHVHDHGNLTGGSRHALAVAGVSHGFLSATDKTKLDGIAAGAQVVNFTNVKAALLTANSSIDINGQKITNSAAPTGATDLVNKGYVDALLFGLDAKQSVRGASLGNQTLSGALTEDGVTYATGNRYLAKDQTDATENGLYVVDTAGPWTRAADADVDAEVTPGLYVYVEEGTVNQKTGWALTGTAPLSVGVDNLVFVQIYGPGAITAGAGLTQTGTTINVGDGPGIEVTADTVKVIFHSHPETQSVIEAGDTAASGSSDTSARGDHQHAVSTAAPGTQVLSDASSAQEGSATSLMRSDARLIVTTAAPSTIGTSNAQGNSTALARANHVHDHGTQSVSNHHAVAVSGGNNGFMSGADKLKLDGIAAGAAALGGAVALPPAVTGALGAGSTASPIDHVHPWGDAASGLVFNRPQHASGAGLKDALRGQAAASGAFIGGKQELGGGAAGDASHKNGDTLIVLGSAPSGSQSAALDVCSEDGGTHYLKVYFDDSATKTVLSTDGKFQIVGSVRLSSTLSHVPYAETPAATVTLAESKSLRRRITLDQNTTFAAPTGFEDGTELILFIRQGGGAPYTATWNGVFTFPTGMSGTLVGSAMDDVDVFRFLFEIDQWVCVTHESY